MIIIIYSLQKINCIVQNLFILSIQIYLIKIQLIVAAAQDVAARLERAQARIDGLDDVAHQRRVSGLST